MVRVIITAEENIQKRKADDKILVHGGTGGGMMPAVITGRRQDIFHRPLKAEIEIGVVQVIHGADNNIGQYHAFTGKADNMQEYQISGSGDKIINRMQAGIWLSMKFPARCDERHETATCNSA